MCIFCHCRCWWSNTSKGLHLCKNQCYITLITVLVDVTYNTNQYWFVANILENKYNLFFYWHFPRWDTICLPGARNFLTEYKLLGEAMEAVLVQVEMVEEEITKVWKKFFTLIWKLLILFWEYRLPSTLIEKTESFNSIEEYYFVVPKGKNN